MITTASRLAWGLLLVGAATLAGCSGDDDSNADTGGTGGSGGGAGAGATAGMGGMECTGTPPVTDHGSCMDIDSDKQGDASFTISSPDFDYCGEIPKADTCDGNPFGTGVSPKLTWSGVPDGTKSLALVFKDISILADNDPTTVPHGWHWAIWDIPPSTTGIDGGMTGPGTPYHSDAVDGALQWSNLAYGFFPPCPNPFPLGNANFTCSLVRDSYSFTLYALPVEKLDLPAPTLDATTNMPTGNYVVNVGEYLESLSGDQAPLGVTEYRGTSAAWASSFTPPSGAMYPCMGGMTDGCLQ